MEKRITGMRNLLIALAALLLVLFHHRPVQALPLSDASHPVPVAAMKLVQFCADPKVGFDSQAVANLINHVIAPKQNKESALPTFRNATGAYYELDTRINFSDFLKYSFSSEIPSVLTSPASLRYSLWTDTQGKSQKMPVNWKLVPSNGKPVIIRGLEQIGITPDINTGIHYKYKLQRTLILLNHDNRQVIISISKQTDISDVGKKGVILGHDDDWNYYYSAETGSTKAGLGWVKSYIYDYFSVGVHIQSGSSPSMVRSGIFQWIRAGWSGINFAEPKHVIKGMKRYARNSKSILESPKLPEPNQLVTTYRRLLALPQHALSEKYTALQQARQQLAVRRNKIAIKNQESHTPREQIIQELMLEYFKISLGKPSLLKNMDI
ncbi:hypothetical protein [Syntrophus aciditrophicus]|uniref:Hypothetical exported protein n=1 Tax=Syntrophus aciditrophicus (strain SB) TaxID=56780 RepID=Q2LTU8_SYNAS|nr:hypothetical protein [Syntrophus aciditrophicus]ABC77504.1 hypothetical exported protein [Syntrophus aciditrophicus SB]OPY14186.1 MAG: hypothetical protein A4E74_02404 [Syntrophus sp. PtaB.Bin075]